MKPTKGASDSGTLRLFQRHPDAQPWVIRIAHRAVYHFGALMFSEKIMIQGVERW